DSVGRPNRAVRTFPVREESGLVWVYLGDPDDIVGEPFAFPRFGEEGWGTYTMVTPFDNSVTNCVENFMDVPHTITVHRGWFRSDKKQAVRTTVERTPGSVLVTYHQDADSIGFSGRVFNPRNEPVTHTDQFTMPNITRVDYDFGTSRSFIITSQCTPISPMKTLVYTAITYRLGNPIFNALGRMVLPPYTRKVIQQDVEIMANQGESLKRYGQDFSNAPVDVIHQWIQSLRDFARSGGQGEPPAPATAEVTFWI
ncbi:MAG: phenylpropionate dioxygenase-like ring-hydroxylating dioxygenase large terminal subunit, partial [Myxococcota bacterium]